MKYLAILLAVMFQVAAIAAPDYDVEQPEFVVKVIDDHGVFMYTGTGTLVRPDLVLSCAHNVRDRTKGSLTVVFKDGTVREAKVLRENQKMDLSLLILEPLFGVVAKPAVASPKVGDVVTIGGFPRAGPYAEVTGQIYKRVITQDGTPMGFEVDDECIRGMSGGPVLNANGRVVGVLWGATNGMSYFTDLENIRKLLDGENWNFLSNPLDK